MEKYICLELLSQKLQESRASTNRSVTAFTIYLAICFALLTFAFKGNPQHSTIPNSFNESTSYKTSNNSNLPAAKRLKNIAHRVMFIGGAASSILYLFACYFFKRSRDHFLEDIDHLNSELDGPLKADQLVALKYTQYATGGFTVVSLSGWLFLLYVYW